MKQGRLLTEAEMEVVAALEQNPEASLREIAQRSNFTVPKVQYLTSKLRREGILAIRPMINPLALGLQDFGIFASTSRISPARMHAFEEWCRRSTCLSWVEEFIGDYHLGLTILARHVKVVAEQLALMSQRGGFDLATHALSPRLCYHYYNRKYLSKINNAPRVLHVQTPRTFATLADELDRRILTLLATSDLESVRALARTLGESHATVDRRIQALRSRGIISGYYVHVSPEHFGVRSYRVLITSRLMTDETRAAFHAFCRSHRSTVVLIEALGSYDLEVSLDVNEASEVTHFCRELNQRFGAAMHTMTTLQAARTVAWSQFPGTQ
jgi:DNA-binding Lrp family transcriptional regulator